MFKKQKRQFESYDKTQTLKPLALSPNRRSMGLKQMESILKNRLSQHNLDSTPVEAGYNTRSSYDNDTFKLEQQLPPRSIYQTLKQQQKKLNQSFSRVSMESDSRDTAAASKPLPKEEVVVQKKSVHFLNGDVDDQ